MNRFDDTEDWTDLFRVNYWWWKAPLVRDVRRRLKEFKETGKTWEEGKVDSGGSWPLVHIVTYGHRQFIKQFVKAGHPIEHPGFQYPLTFYCLSYECYIDLIQSKVPAKIVHWNPKNLWHKGRVSDAEFEYILRIDTSTQAEGQTFIIQYINAMIKGGCYREDITIRRLIQLYSKFWSVIHLDFSFNWPYEYFSRTTFNTLINLGFFQLRDQTVCDSILPRNDLKPFFVREQSFIDSLIHAGALRND
jgi:hypothetical protein